MSNWFPIFLLPFVTLGIPMLAIFLDLIGMSRDTSAFSQLHASTPSEMEHAGIATIGSWSDRQTLSNFLECV